MAIAVAMPAYAQDDFEDEIIVTATKREQTLQEVPIAVTVTTAETIERAQILDLKDLQSVVPTLRIPTFQNANQSNFVIRGFGNGANNPGIEPSVGVFIDGVYRSRAAAQIGDLPKLERVEVISGPQSTLFGKNASVGVISIVTAEPTFDQTGFLEVGYGNFNQYLAEGYISGGLSDNLAVAVSGGLNIRDGYFDGVDVPIAAPPGEFAPGATFGGGVVSETNDVNERNRFNVRGDVLYEPTENWKFRVVADYNRLDESCCAAALIDLIDGAPTLADGTPVGTAQNGATLFGASQLFFGLNSNDPSDPFSFQIATNDNPVNEIDDYGISLHSEVDISDDLDIVSISALRYNDSFTDLDADFSNIDFLPVASQDTSIRTFTQELRLNGRAFDDRATWTLGGFYFNEDIDFDSALQFGDQTRNVFEALTGAQLGGPPTTGAFALVVAEVFGGIPLGTAFSPEVRIDETFALHNESFSIFGNVDFDVTEDFVITLGAAYIDDEKEFSGSTINNDLFSDIDLFSIVSPVDLTPLSALQFQPQFFDIVNPVEDNFTSDDQVTYTVRGAYDVSDNINLYASYSTGFKASSVNLSRDSRPNLDQFVDANGAPILENFALLPNNYSVRLTDGTLITNATTALPVGATVNPLTARNFGTRAAGPEETDNIEVGFKSKFDWGIANLTLFQTTVDGFQSNVFNGAGFVLANAGEQRSRGAEWEVAFDVFDDALQLGFAGAYIDAEYISFDQSTDIFNIPQDRSGSTVAGISPLNFVVSATYNHSFENGMEGYIRGDFNFEEETPLTDAGTDFDRENSIVNSAVGAVPITSATNFVNSTREVRTFNFAAGLDLDNGVSVAGFIRNAFNDEYLQQSFNSPGLFGLIRGYPNQPRTFGGTLRYTFGGE